MNRNTEYDALLLELQKTPPELEYTMRRALAREKASRRRRWIGLPAGSLALCAAAFVLLVNLSVPFARACGSVPLLRELAKAVAFSPSLSAAVENEYVQPVGITKTQDDITVTVEYVIVDRKQLNIFYTARFPRDMEERGLFADYDYGLGDTGSWASASGDSQVKSGELKQVKLEFVESDVPSSMELGIGFCDREALQRAEPEPSMAETPEYREPDFLTRFSFHLEFDPYYTAQGEIIPVDTEFTLDGQRFTLTEVELYPTHLRVNIRAAEGNTAGLAGLELYLENEHGERFERPGGLTSAGDPESEEGAVFLLDSSFFSHGGHLTLYITRASWKDRDAPRVRLDLSRGTAENLPQGVQLLKAEHPDSDTWKVTFLKRENEIGTLGNLMSCNGFWDEAGNHYDIWQSGSSISCRDPETGEWVEEEGVVFEDFPLRGFYGTVIYLEPSYHRVTNFETPVAIPIK